MSNRRSSPRLSHGCVSTSIPATSELISPALKQSLLLSNEAGPNNRSRTARLVVAQELLLFESTNVAVQQRPLELVVLVQPLSEVCLFHQGDYVLLAQLVNNFAACTVGVGCLKTAHGSEGFLRIAQLESGSLQILVRLKLQWLDEILSRDCGDFLVEFPILRLRCFVLHVFERVDVAETGLERSRGFVLQLDRSHFALSELRAWSAQRLEVVRAFAKDDLVASDLAFPKLDDDVGISFLVE